jgi:NADPH2:quinone reductase
MKQTLPKNMQAAAIDRFGGIDTIRLQTLPIPEIASDEILIRVESAGVGAWDPYEREGMFANLFGTVPKFPYVLGSEGAGKVAAVGKEVRKFKEGDRVYALSLANPKGGFYAQYVAVKAHQVSHIPGKLTIEKAGAMSVDAITAMRGLELALDLKQGESLMIFGASGGIGHMAVQLAKRMGARVFAIASGADGVALVARLGADIAVDGHKDDLAKAAREFAPAGIDAALLTAGGKTVEKALAAMRRGGRAAYPNGVQQAPDARSGLVVKSYDGTPDPQVMEKLNHLIEAGPFDVHIANVFSLDRAAEAHRALAHHHLGKIALRP